MPLPLLELPSQPVVDEIDEEILEIFVEEVQEVLEEIGTHFSAWKNNPSDKEALTSLRRAFHTLKGSGRLVGAAAIGELGWRFENLFNRLLDGTLSRSDKIIKLVEQAQSTVPLLIEDFQQGEQTLSYAVRLLISQTHHLTETKGAELGDFEGPPEAVGSILTAEQPATDTLPPFDYAQGEESSQREDETAAANTFPPFDYAQGEERSRGESETAAANTFPERSRGESETATDTPPPFDHAQGEERSRREEAEAARPPAAVVEAESRDRSGEAMLLAIFREEAATHLKTLKTFIVKCHQGSLCHPDEPLVRALHTLNGSSRSVGYMDIAALAAQMEAYGRSCLERRLTLKKDVLALMIESGKMFEAILNNQGKAVDTARHAKLLAVWNRLLSSLAADEAPAFVPTAPPAPTLIQTMPSTPPPSRNEPAAPKHEEPLPEAGDEFMEIFLEEAEEILETCQSLLGRWQTAPNSMPLLKELQRELHTLKGGARMVGITTMGDLSHQLESVLTRIVDGNAQSNPTLQGIVQESVDELATMMDVVRSGKVPPAANHLISRIAGALEGRSEAPEPTPAKPSAAAKPEMAQPEPPTTVEETPAAVKGGTDKPAADEGAAADSDERVRVRATLIDKLTNLAGEMAISRAHLEQQQGAIKGNIGEMEQTVTRLRDQLRRLEMETEVQIMSHFGQVNSDTDTEEFDPLEMDRFSLMQQLSRSLMETVNDLKDIQDNLSNMSRYSDTLLIQQGRIGAELQDGIMRTRMVPFSQITPRLQRIARLTARELRKRVDFTITDDTVEFERTVLNRVVAPLEHMLRNAIGHGVEEPEARAKTSKSSTASVTLDITQEGAELVLRLSDDGAGLDYDAIRRKAEQRGLIKSGQRISEQDLASFILEPAFSTAKTITQVSGRGVGMDIANSEIRQLGGTLNIHSQRGQGTTFEIRLPMSLTISQALLVHVSEETLAVPLHNVNAVLRAPRQEVLSDLNEARFYRYMERDYRTVHLADLLGFPRASSDSTLLPILLVSSADSRVALVVDFIEGSREVVVKAVGPQLSAIRWVAGATILGDGRVVIILDVLSLLRSNLVNEVLPILEDTQEPKAKVKMVMVVDDSITVRKVTANFLKRQGLEVVTAKDGVDAVAQLQEVTPDLMLLDVEMPRMDGFELATQVRNTERLKHIPIIMITSRTGNKHRERASKIGIDRHLGKPFNEMELMESINALLAEKS